MGSVMIVRRRPTPLRGPLAWESFASLYLGKQVSHAEAGSASRDSSDWESGEPLIFGR